MLKILILNQNTIGMILERCTRKINTAIFISGNGSNMIRIIEEIENGVLNNTLELRMVFSDNKDSLGLKRAEALGLNTVFYKQYYKNRKKGEINLLNELNRLNINFIILAGYMRILSPFFIKSFKGSIINIHPADTDEYKGKNAYEWVFENKLRFSKITIHIVNEDVDSGRVLYKKEFKIPLNATLEEIKRIGLKTEHNIYSKVIRNYIRKELIKKH